MPTFGVSEIKAVILQCKNPECQHDHVFPSDQGIAIPWQCKNCKTAWIQPAVIYQQPSRDVQGYSLFLNLVSGIRRAEALEKETAIDKIVPFRIRFEFAEPTT